MTRENEETPTKTFHAGIEQWKESELPSISEVVVNRLNAEDAVDVFSMALVENGFGAFREMFEDALASHYTVISTSPEAARKSSSGVTTCAFCHKSVRPFAHAGGIWAGTVADLASLKIEPDNALICSSCHSTTCPVCLGNEATKKGIRQFVCPLCGHTPVKEIYRV